MLVWVDRWFRESFKKGIFSSQVLSGYEKLWRKAIQSEILIGYYSRKIWGKLSNTQIEKIFLLAKDDGVIPFLRKKGDFNWHSEFILTFMKRSPFGQFFKEKSERFVGTN